MGNCASRNASATAACTYVTRTLSTSTFANVKGWMDEETVQLRLGPGVLASLAKHTSANRLNELALSDRHQCLLLWDQRLTQHKQALLIERGREHCMHCLHHDQMVSQCLHALAEDGADATLLMHQSIEKCSNYCNEKTAPEQSHNEYALICRPLSLAPPLVVVENALPQAQCDSVLEYLQSESAMQRSRVSGGRVSQGRTSRSIFLRNKPESANVLQAHLRDIVTLPAVQWARTQLLQPAGALVANEPLQAALYHEGEFFCRHYDNPGQSVARAVTAIGYLNDCKTAAGATHFPKAVPVHKQQEDGIRFYPKAGHVLVFWSVAGGKELPESVHEGEVCSSTKAIITQWFEEQLYDHHIHKC